MDILGGAIAFAVVIYAILNRAVDALDVLLTALSLFVHHGFSFRILNFRRNPYGFSPDILVSNSLSVVFAAAGRDSAALADSLIVPIIFANISIF